MKCYFNMVKLGIISLGSMGAAPLKLLQEHVEGVRSVELANVMLYSSLKKEQVDLPLNGSLLQQELERLCANSTFQKHPFSGGVANLDDSF